MTTYTRTVDAELWDGGDNGLESDALCIVAWVNANGGEARYEPAYRHSPEGSPTGARNPEHPARIAVRTSTGEMGYAKPGDAIVVGERHDICEHDNSPPTCRNWRTIRAFTVIPAAEWSSQGWSS